MIKQFVINDSGSGVSFLDALETIIENASALDIAVSYVQISGWVLFEKIIRNIEPSNIRLLITDQFGFTHPEAMRRAYKYGLQIRSYIGNRIYHPKVFLVYDTHGQPVGALVGSANMSESGFVMGVEAGVVFSDLQHLEDLRRWFDNLFHDNNQTVLFDDNVLRKFSEVWNKASARRIKLRQIAGRKLTGSASPEDMQVLEDLFSTIKLPIGILSIDHARNNVRNLTRLIDVLSRYPNINSKERSELRLLGFIDGNKLTSLGNKAHGCQTEKEFAEIWCGWVLNQTPSRLETLNPRILGFKRAAQQFWRLHPDVRKFFFGNLQSNKNRDILQTVELLCNASDLVKKLLLVDFRQLAPLLLKQKELPAYLSRAILDYKNNKGSRSWKGKDRRTMLTAWHDVSKKKRVQI